LWITDQRDAVSRKELDMEEREQRDEPFEESGADKRNREEEADVEGHKRNRSPDEDIADEDDAPDFEGHKRN